MTTPLVSICCITYNQELYIRQCIDGFFMQKTTFPFEVLIHDDASTDNTANIIREYEVKYPDIIKPIYQTENQYSKGIKVSATYNFPRVKGKYIAICEGDDYWIDPLKLQKQVNFLETNIVYGLVYTDINRLNQKKQKIEKNFFKNKNIKNTFEDFLINAWFLGPCTWVIRKNILDKISHLLKSEYIVGDLPMLLGISGYSKIKYIDKSTSVYQILE